MSAPLAENKPEEITPPKNVRYLEGRIAERAKAENSTVAKLKSLVANLAVCQMLPPSAVKGGTGLKLRLGESLTRQTPDLDTAFRGNMQKFEAQLRENLAAGWGDFTGAVVPGTPRAPESVPAAYVMQPFAVKLQYRNKSFTTVELEVGFDELEATGDLTETALSTELIDTFAALGLPRPNPVSVLPLHHQVAQKLHACTEPGSQRAHDLVDLQLMAVGAVITILVLSIPVVTSCSQSEPRCPESTTGLDDLTLVEAEGLVGTTVLFCGISKTGEVSGPTDYSFEKPWDSLLAVDGMDLPQNIQLTPKSKPAECRLDASTEVVFRVGDTWLNARSVGCSQAD